MKKLNQKYLLLSIISIPFVLFSFICLESCKYESAKELDNHIVPISTPVFDRLITTPRNNDTIPSASKYIYIPDSIQIYKGKDDTWIKRKLNNSILQYIHNDSIQIGNTEAILINIKNKTPYFTKDTSSYSRIELIDSSNNKSIHSYYELNEQIWKLTKQTTYDFSNRRIYKVDIYYNYHDAYTSELKNVYSVSITNPISKTNIDKYFDGKSLCDTFYHTKFDSYGNFKSQIRQGRDQNSEVVVFSKVNYDFNSQGLKTKITNYDNDNGQLKNIGYSEFSYDTNKRLIRKRVLSIDDNPTNYIVKYKYNLFGSCIEQYYERNDNGYPFVRKQFIYNEKNQLIGYTHQNKMNENDDYRIIDNRAFEYDNINGYITKIIHDENVEMHIELDKFGNIVEGFKSAGGNRYRTKFTFDYSISYHDIRMKYEHNRFVNLYKSAVVDEYGLKYNSIKKPYSHALKTMETYKLNGLEQKLAKVTRFTYKEALKHISK